MSEKGLTPDQEAEIAASAERGDRWTPSGIHLNYGDAEDRYVADHAQMLDMMQYVPPAIAERLAADPEAVAVVLRKKLWLNVISDLETCMEHEEDEQFNAETAEDIAAIRAQIGEQP